MSVTSDRDLTCYIPLGGTASSMSSSGKRSAVQTRATRKKAAALEKQLGEMRLKQLKAKCALEISNLELDIMEKTIHSEVCDDEETDSHHQMSVPLLDQDDGSSLDTIPYNTSTYVNLPTTYEETRGQQSSKSMQSGAEVPQQMPSGRSPDGVTDREMVASNLLVSFNSTQSGTEVPQQMPSIISPDGVTNREMETSNLLVSSNSIQSGAEVPQQMPSGRIPDGVTFREMVASNLLVSSNSMQSGAEVPQQMPSSRSPDGVPNREMVASNLLVSFNSTQPGTEEPQQMLSGRSPDGVTNREMVASNLLVSSNSMQSGAEVPQQMPSGRSPHGVTFREMVASNLLVSSNSVQSGVEVPQRMPSGRSPDGVTNREMETSNLLVSSNSMQSGAEVPQQMPSGRSPDGVTNRERVASNLLVSSNSMQSGAEVPQQMPSGRSPDGVTNRERVASNLLESSNSMQTGAEVPQQMPSGRSPDGVTNREMMASGISSSYNSTHPDVDVAQQIPPSGYLGGDVNIEVCAQNHMALRSNNNVNPHSDIRWHPPRPHQPGMASTPLDNENPAVAEEANFGIPSRGEVPAAPHVSYAEPHVLPPTAQPAGANVHAPTWISNQPGYMSTPSAVSQSNNIHPHVSTPYNDMTHNNRNSENNISYTPHVADLSSTDPELSNRNVLDRGRNELSNNDVYEKMAAAMRDSISLPKPELLTFDGSSRMYMQFMRNFECNIANRVPDYRLKLQYLVQYCNVEVQNYISSCIMMEPKEGYNKALEILAMRYGNPHVIQKSYLKKVLDGGQLRPSDYKGLSDLAHDMQQCSIALKSLGYKCDLDSGETMLKISRRFPTHVRARWIRESSNIIDRYNRDPTFEEMTWYILGEARTANTMYGQDFYHEATTRTSMKQIDNSGTRIKATTLVTRNVAGGSEHKHGICTVCNEDQHPVWKCDKFMKMCLDDRKELVKTNKWCSNCFSKRHVVTECQHGKKLCNRRECKDMHKHNTLVCSSIIAQDDNTKPEGNVLSTTQTGKNIYLRVVPVCVFGSNGTEISTYALLDDCADITLITKSLRNKLQLTGKKKTLSLSTVNKSNGAVQSEQLDVNVSSIDKQSKLQLGGAYVVDSLPVTKASIATNEDIGNWPHLQNIDLPKPTNKEVTILISSAHPEAFYVYEQKQAQPGMPYASKSLLGWSVIGPASRDAKANGCINFVTNETLEEQLQRLWNTEFNDVNAYTTQRTSSIEDSRALKVMKDTVTLVDGHQTIGLPWRSNPPPLYDNRIMAANRADMLMKRLQKNPELKDSYCATIDGYIAKGYAYKITNAEENITPRYYLPHHPVFHPQKKKLRVVFDAAAKYRGQSLNGMLLQGPDLTNNLIGVLQRFRKHNIALSADIQEMFMQVKVNKRDSNALRFLWWQDHDFTKAPTDYAMTTHTFGLNSSPSVCNFALRHTADQHKDKYRNETISTVYDSFYVDDLLTSVANIEDANMLVKEVTELLSLGGFNLTKWVSNSREVMHEIEEKQRAPSLVNMELGEMPTERTLGILWNVETDTFQFTSINKERPHTRRGILSVLSSFYDPLGFFAPVTLIAKKISQDLCREQLGWDDLVNNDVRDKWLKWCSTLGDLSNVSIQRCHTPVDFGAVMSTELHYFADASLIAYGAVAYMRLVDDTGRIHVTFLMGKARLAPMKPVTIPRLELAAAVVAVRMHNSIMTELQPKTDNVTFWTDSTSVLWYIKNEQKRFHTYVANRVAIIHELSNVAQWKHIPTEHNPADYASRGLASTDKEGIQNWLIGPTFLWHNDNWPTQPYQLPLTLENAEVKTAKVNLVVKPEPAMEAIIKSCSSWYKLQVIVAWLHRYQQYCIQKYLKQNNVNVLTGAISLTEMKNASEIIVRYVQNQEFADDYEHLQNNHAVLKSSSLVKLSPMLQNSILKVGGRLQNSTLQHEEKHPIILPYKHQLTDMVIHQIHCDNGHIGVNAVLSMTRQHYWIVKGHAAVKRVVSRCILCKRRNVKPREQLMAPLPADRMTPDKPPFSTVGVDFFGPLMVKERRSTVKRYGCIFTCMSMRAVHIEITHSLDTNSFLCAMQRFISRRGMVEKVYSDNGTNLVSGHRELKESIDGWNQSKITDTLRQKGIEWHFNPPLGSHHGGVWERLIGVAKKILKMLVNEQLVNDETLLTLMAEVERIMNSRPLTKCSTDPRDEAVLSPNQLLHMKDGKSLPYGVFDPKDGYVRRWWKQAQRLSNMFWKRWIREYLPTLQLRHKWVKLEDNLQMGDLVLVMDENTPRGQWPLGRITKTRPDRQGNVRSVEVLSKGSIKTRPITKLCLLEACGNSK